MNNILKMGTVFLALWHGNEFSPCPAVQLGARLLEPLTSISGQRETTSASSWIHLGSDLTDRQNFRCAKQLRGCERGEDRGVKVFTVIS